MRHDADWIVVGSGFGGSVAALRLAEKGYSVLVLEAGNRFEDEDFALSTWNLQRFLWAPRLGFRGIMRISPLKDVTVLSGSGVGGGSLVYANTLYRAPKRFFDDAKWAGLADWEGELTEQYDVAEAMLGADEVSFRDPGDDVLRAYAQRAGVADTHRPTTVGVYFGREGEEVPDPYFGGEGPTRTGCIRCGTCMLGCRFGAKNTLVKNYLWLAERRGVRIEAQQQVIDVAPLGAEDGSDGYRVRAIAPGPFARPGRGRREYTAQGVVFAAGALGTNRLMRKCRERGSLPRLSDRLGHLVRTNSEAILAVTAPNDDLDFTRRVAITSSIYPDADTHIETVTYGARGNSMRLLFTLLTGPGTRWTRPRSFFGQVVRRPRRVLQQLAPGTWSRRTLILLVMQTLDNHMRLRPVKAGSRFVGLTTEQDPDNPNPTYIAAANDAAQSIADEIGGFAQSSISEALLNTPVTAHILGGAVIAANPDEGVVDARHRVFGYANMLVADGAAMPANPGVNPSLTITAMAERALSLVEPKPGATLPSPVSVRRPFGDEDAPKLAEQMGG